MLGGTGNLHEALQAQRAPLRVPLHGARMLCVMRYTLLKGNIQGSRLLLLQPLMLLCATSVTTATMVVGGTDVTQRAAVCELLPRNTYHDVCICLLRPRFS